MFEYSNAPKRSRYSFCGGVFVWYLNCKYCLIFSTWYCDILKSCGGGIRQVECFESNHIPSSVLKHFLKIIYRWTTTNMFCVQSVQIYTVYVWKICPACYLKITWLIECPRYFHRILICENMFKCKAYFVSYLILKFGFNSSSILSFSCSYIKVSMHRTRCTNNSGK